MDHRAAVALLLLAVPLLAFPVASPPPDPPDLAHQVYSLSNDDIPEPPADSDEYDYRNLSERAQSVFDAAREQDQFYVREDNPISEFGVDQATVVEYDGERYVLTAQVHPRPPSLQSKIVRLISLLAGVLVGGVGVRGYLIADE